MTTTPILNLKKPDASDAVKRSDFNFNWDLLDAHIHDLANMTGVAPVSKGGTGGGDAASARANIGANDAANLTTGTLNSARLPVAPVAKGGTGADNEADARSNLGAAGTAVATALANGLMSATDKAKLDGVADNANNYSHPNSGVSAGTYRKLTVNNQGHVTAANNDPVAVAEGGTGGGTPATARQKLGVPPTIHTDDVGAYGKASGALYGHAMAGSVLPSAPGSANAGTDNGKFAREDHRHPLQSTITGNAGTATKLAAARTIAIAGGATASGVSFDGSGNISLSVTALDVSKATAGALAVARGGTGATTPSGIVANIKSPLVDLIFPVGAIYLSVNSTSPATLFGGTWSQITDRFLLAAGSTYTAGATGGEATHILTTREMPGHTHTTKNTRNGASGTDRWTIDSSSSDTNNSSSTGGGEAHNNMPPYLVVYVWKRTA